MANPWALMPAMLGIVCKPMCNAEGLSGTHKACIFPLVLAKLGDAVASLKGLSNMKELMNLDPASGSCDQLDKYMEKNQ